MEKLRIVFMGTPDFAVGILDSILKNKYQIVGVVTAADKPAGRGQKTNYSAVKQYALQNHLKLLQPTNLKDPDFVAELQNLQANLQVVVAFRMLPEVVWRYPKFGTFNLHASLLPNYRGAAPINWTLINGETTTGVSTFFIDHKIDTGALIIKSEIEISETDSAGTLHDKLMHLGSQAVLKTLQLIEKNEVKTTTQLESTIVKTAPKLTKETCKIDFSQPGTVVYNFIRGLSPYPCAWCVLIDNNADLIVKIYEAAFKPEPHLLAIGTVVSTKKELKIALVDGFLEILTLQMPGKKKMRTADLMNGHNFSVNCRVN